MSKNTSINLGQHFDEFIQERIEMGRFGNRTEAMRAGLRLLEAEEKKLDSLRQHLSVGEQQAKQGQLRKVAKEGFKSIKSK